MNNRGQIGQIITSFPSLILIFLIMLLFMIVSGFMGKDLADVLSIECSSPMTSEQRLNIEQSFPSKNAERGSLIDQFLKSSIKTGDDVVTIQCAIEKMCFAKKEDKYWRDAVDSNLENKFSSLVDKKNGKRFAVLSRIFGTNSKYFYRIHSSNHNFEIGSDLVISLDEFNKVFPENSLLQKKTLCNYAGEVITLYVLSEDSQ